MASTYSTNLALELMATGEKANTWGDITNTNLGTLLEQAISGYVTQAITDGSGATTTITIPNGATGVARNMFIEMTGALTFSTTSLVVPANKKLYFIYNNTSGGYPVQVKVSGQTGVAVPNGQKVVLVSNGTDVVVATNYMASLGLGTPLAVSSGGTGLSSGTSGGVLYFSSTSALASSAALAANALVIGGGAGVAPSTITTGTGVVTALGVNTGSAGAFVVNGGALGTPSSGTVTNLTGTASININGTVGATTPTTGAFTTASATTSVTTPSVTNAGTLALSATSTNIITASTNGSERMRVDSSGNIDIGTTSNAVFDASGAARPLVVQKSDTSTTLGGSLAAIAIVNGDTTTSNTAQLNFAAITGASASQYSSAWISCIFGARTNTQYPTGQLVFATSTTLNSAPSEKLRIDNSGNVGIGTSSPGAKLSVVGTGYSPNITLTDAATIAWDTSTGQVATFTFVSSNRTMGAPTNLVNGGFYALAVIQNAGSNTLTWNSIFKWTGGTAPTLSTAAGAKDYFVFRSDGTNLYQQGISQAVA